MGTSIHPFIEMDYSTDNPAPFCPAMDGRLEVHPFNIGEFVVSNDYDLFDSLAFGRSIQIDGGRHDGKRPLFPARGLPANLSWNVTLRFYHVVIDDDYDSNRFDPALSVCFSLPPVTRETALEWVRQGKSQWGNALRTQKFTRQKKLELGFSYDLISNPNWHTPSWLTLIEIERALENFEIATESIPGEFQAIIAAMKMLESHLGAGKTRLVFWFDS